MRSEAQAYLGSIKRRTHAEYPSMFPSACEFIEPQQMSLMSSSTASTATAARDDHQRHYESATSTAVSESFY